MRDILAMVLAAFIVLGIFYWVLSGESRSSSEKEDVEKLTIEVVDGCEYVLWHSGYGGQMVHHGNCKNH